jgi:2,4-dienoyl-CoA reductase-like NADH-dependent reductase (Old Yellow Enzyme family)
MRVFEQAMIGRVKLPNRLIRSATFEGLCDPEGAPGVDYERLYAGLAGQQLGALITGFAFVSQNGRAMQPGQAGLECDRKLPLFRRVTRAVHERGCPIFLQLAHAGRQTSATAAGGQVYAPSPIKSRYFGVQPRALTGPQVQDLISAFSEAAGRAKEAGFDGVQLHAAHGYLIHQFLHPAMNRRKDDYGIDATTALGTAFLGAVIDRVRDQCGPDFPVLVKVSSGDNYRRRLSREQFVRLIEFLDVKGVDAIEVSFGTMDHGFNIFRAESIPLKTVLDFNPRYRTRNPARRWLWRVFVLPALRRQFQPFQPMYNLPAALLAKEHTRIPIITVGGLRSGSDIRHAIEEVGIDFVSLCRALLCEPDFVVKLKQDPDYQSRCTHCNRCAVMCDSGFSTRCYGRRPPSTPMQV